MLFRSGYVLGNTGKRNAKYGFQDNLDLVQVDWDGNIVWKFDHTEDHKVLCFIRDKIKDANISNIKCEHDLLEFDDMLKNDLCRKNVMKNNVK